MFVDEEQVYRLVRLAGLAPPRHAWVQDAVATFEPGEEVVVKGLGEDLWHKSEAGAVAFVPIGSAAEVARAMRPRVEAAGHRWIGALVCERIAVATLDGLVCEAFVSVSERQGIWTVMMGLGGVRAEALAELAPPLLWPVAWVSPELALAELRAHLLGRTWLGALRGTHALTSEAQLATFLRALWSLAERAAADGLRLVEMNPVGLDACGVPRPLDGVGVRAHAEPVTPPPRAPEFMRALVSPRRVAVAGVSARADSPGHVIATNLARADATIERLILKPEAESFLGMPCLPDVAALAGAPVDLLIVALPAAAAVAMVEALIAQGGGAAVVGLIAGGIGDGADHEGLATRLADTLAEARRAGAWTPAVVGPNLLGLVVPALGLDTTFIPSERWRPDARPGGLALVSQSGAFMLSRLAACPGLGLGLGLALGNQLDVDLADVLGGIADAAEGSIAAVAAYVEGFAPGALERTARAAEALSRQGRPVVLYRAGRTREGQAAAASHTGAMAGDLELERAVLTRAGVSLAPTIGAFEAAMRWLAAYPMRAAEPRGPVAIISNAGFEAVCGADWISPPNVPFNLSEIRRTQLQALLARHGLDRLVSPRLPLDLTPMASNAAFIEAIGLVAEEASTVLVGLVPFTACLDLATLESANRFADQLASIACVDGPSPPGRERIARQSKVVLALVVDGGPEWEPLRAAFARVGLPVFATMEAALMGYRLVTLPSRDLCSTLRA